MRIVTKIGFVYEVDLGNGYKRYLQLIAFDIVELNSDVIRVFSKSYPSDSDVKLPDIIQDDIQFYAHMTVAQGVRDGGWKKVGKADVGDLSHIVFRRSNDFGLSRELNGKPSEKWYLWKLGDEKTTYVGKADAAVRNAEIGLIFAYPRIDYRIRHGRYEGDHTYLGVYPDQFPDKGF